MEGDEWKPIPNFSWYLASKRGQIFDIAENKLVKQYNHASGYKMVRVMDDSGKVGNIGVHRLIYQAFYGTYPEYLEINHKDENKGNNNAENLEAITHIENVNYGTRNKRISKVMAGRPLKDAHKANISKSLKGIRIRETTKQAVSKALSKPVAQFTTEGKIIAKYNSITEAYLKTGINHIGGVCKGYRRLAGGFVWRYL